MKGTISSIFVLGVFSCAAFAKEKPRTPLAPELLNAKTVCIKAKNVRAISLDKIVDMVKKAKALQVVRNCADAGLILEFSEDDSDMDLGVVSQSVGQGVSYGNPVDIPLVTIVLTVLDPKTQHVIWKDQKTCGLCSHYPTTIVFHTLMKEIQSQKRMSQSRYRRLPFSRKSVASRRFPNKTRRV